MSSAVQTRERRMGPEHNDEDDGAGFHAEHAVRRRTMEGTESNQQVEKPAAPSKAARSVLRWLLVSVAIVAATGAGVAYYIRSLSFESTDDAFIEGHVVPVSARVPGHVATVYVTDNQWVNKGDLLARLDPADFETRLKAADAALRAGRATCKARELAIAAARAGLAESQAALVAAEARRDRAEAKLRRVESLVPEHAASKDNLDEATAAVQVTCADVAASREKIRVQQSNVEQATAAAAAAVSSVQQAEAEVKQFQLNLSYTKICAPLSGHVTRKSVEAGAFVQVGQPLLAVVDPDVWVIANFKETQLAKMRPGQTVTVTVDTQPDARLAAHLDSVQRGSGARFSLLPPENATGNYVKVVQRVPVKIVFDDPKQIERYALGPGMSVVPTVRIKELGKSSVASDGRLTR